MNVFASVFLAVACPALLIPLSNFAVTPVSGVTGYRSDVTCASGTFSSRGNTSFQAVCEARAPGVSEWVSDSCLGTLLFLLLCMVFCAYVLLM